MTAEIPVTERMIEAGARGLYRHGVEGHATYQEIAETVYRAMHQAHLAEQAEARAERTKAREG